MPLRPGQRHASTFAGAAHHSDPRRNPGAGCHRQDDAADIPPDHLDGLSQLREEQPWVSLIIARRGRGEDAFRRQIARDDTNTHSAGMLPGPPLARNWVMPPLARNWSCGLWHGIGLPSRARRHFLVETFEHRAFPGQTEDGRAQPNGERVLP
jgi:hypothetical protein